jgi:SAM-dependent methyltransferase
MDQDEIKKYFEVNKELWDGWTELHERSNEYDVKGFKQGRSTLHHIELEELDHVSGKSMLHLQCHFGLDTLSWQRLGARVTGVDFSEKAISLARSLNQETGLKARFIHSNIYDLKQKLAPPFDIVFTSYGILAWLPDLKKWAEIIHFFLNKGGTFYIVEFHPILNMIDDNGNLQALYFNEGSPMAYECKGSYAAPQADFTHQAYEWNHPLSEIITCLIETELRIEFVHEFPFTISGEFPFLVKDDKGLYRFRKKENRFPLMFSIKATKPG